MMKVVVPSVIVKIVVAITMAKMAVVVDDNNNDNNDRTEKRNSRFRPMQSPHWLVTVSNAYAQVDEARSCANRVQHIECLSRATCCVPRGTKGQFSCYV